MKFFFKHIIIFIFSFTVFSSEAITVKKVYRADSRAPSDVFANGFRAWGTNINFNAHILGYSGRRGTRDSAFIPTTVRLPAAENFAADLLNVSPTSTSYVYNIRATDNFYYATETLYNIYNSLGVRVPEEIVQTLATEQEYSAYAYISPEQIESVSIHRRTPDGTTIVTHELNPNYRAGETHSNDEPFRQGPQTIGRRGAPLLMGASMTNINNEQPDNSAWLPSPSFTHSSISSFINFNCFCSH